MIILAAAAASMAVACNKDIAIQNEKTAVCGERICFSVSGEDMEINTKVDAVTSLASFNVMAATGAAGAETQTWLTTATKSGDKYVTNKYWPYTDPSYHFYASNASVSMESGKPVVTCNGSLDVVCASKLDPTFNSASNTLLFKHPMARIGTVTAESSKGYTVSSVSVTMQNMKTAGKYDLRAESWSNETIQASYPVPLGANDSYIVPGTYSTSVTFTLTKGDYTGTFTRTGSVTLVKGKVNNIAISLNSDPAVPVNFTVTVEDWDSTPVSLSLS